MPEQPNELIVLDTPAGIEFYRLAALTGALKLEMSGFRRSRSPSAYMIIKRDFGLTGTRGQVLAKAEALIERRINDRYRAAQEMAEVRAH